MSSPRIVLATSPELRDALYAFRYRIFGGELAARLGAEATATGRLCDGLDMHAFNYVALDGSGVVGSLRIVDGAAISSFESIGERYEIPAALRHFRLHEICLAGRLAIARPHRRGPLLLRLVETAYSDARRRGVRVAFSDCSSHLIRLYESIGYVRCGTTFEDPIFGLKYPIVWVLGDLHHMRSIESPMWPTAHRFAEDPRAAQWLATWSTSGRRGRETAIPADGGGA